MDIMDSIGTDKVSPVSEYMNHTVVKSWDVDDMTCRLFLDEHGNLLFQALKDIDEEIYQWAQWVKPSQFYASGRLGDEIISLLVNQASMAFNVSEYGY